jgi:hypothetical protein
MLLKGGIVMNKTALLVGYGEIGKALHEYLKNRLVIDIQDEDKGHDVMNPRESYDYLLVCIPYNGSFVNAVTQYIELAVPECIIIFSTVPIGTTKIWDDAVHIPIEGLHPNLLESIRKWKFMVGYNKKKAMNIALELLYAHKCTTIFNSDNTEAYKLLSTTLYGLNIEFARMANDICEMKGLKFDGWNEYNKNYNTLYTALGFPEYTRYILYPPKGKIGGHCVLPNAEILINIVEHPLIDCVRKGDTNETIYRDNTVQKK